MKTQIGALLAKDLFIELNVRSLTFPGGKSGIVKEALRVYFDSNPMVAEQAAEVERIMTDDVEVV